MIDDAHIGLAQSKYRRVQLGSIPSQISPTDDKLREEDLREWEEDLTTREKNLRIQQGHLRKEQERLTVEAEYLRNIAAQKKSKRRAAPEWEPEEEQKEYFKKKKREINAMAKRIPRRFGMAPAESINISRNTGVSRLGKDPNILKQQARSSIDLNPTRLDPDLILRQYNTKNIDQRTYQMAMDMIEAEEKLEKAAEVAVAVAKFEFVHGYESPTRELIRKEYDEIDPRIMRNWEAEQLNLVALNGGEGYMGIVKAEDHEVLNGSGASYQFNRLSETPYPRRTIQNIDFNNTIIESTEHDSTHGDSVQIKTEPTDDD